MDDIQAALSLLRMDVKERPRLIWDIPKFTKLRGRIISGDKQREMLSDIFETHENGYQMQLSLWPDGGVEGDESRSTSVSTYVLLREGPNDDQLDWPFRGIIKICVEDPSGYGSHIIYELDTTADDQADSWGRCQGGRGQDHFIPLNDVESYLEDGRLRVIVAVHRIEQEED